MTAIGPTTIGGNQVNNAFTVSFHPTVEIPAGAMILVAGATSAPDTAIFSFTDTKSNTYYTQVQGQPVDALGNPAPMSLLVAFAPAALALTTADTITVTCDSRQQILIGANYYTGAQGNFTAADTEWSQGAALSYTTHARAGQSLIALVAVNGPQSDGFVQAAGWGADVGGGAGTAGLSIHGGARTADVDGNYTYSPTLGRARWSAGFLLAFQ